MMEGVPMRYLFPTWAAVAVGRVLSAPSDSLVSYVLLGLLWLLSAVLLVVAIKLLIAADTLGRKIEAGCLGLMMAALLVQGIIGNQKTIGITTPIFFSSLAVLAYVYARRWRHRGPVSS